MENIKLDCLVRTKTSRGIWPPYVSSVLNQNRLEPFENSPPSGVNFGNMKDEVKLPKSGVFEKGNRPSATFWSSNPRYDLLKEGTFAVVETIQGERWTPVYDDDFSLYFRYKLDESGLNSVSNLEWEMRKEAKAGVYRLRHFGSSRKSNDSLNVYFTGASSAFAVS